MDDWELMQTFKLSPGPEAVTTVTSKCLLIVGPKPPPIGGSPITVQAMLEELAYYPSIQVGLINTSPSLDVRKKMTGFNLEKVRRSISILPEYSSQIRQSDAILVFANNLFAITIVPILLMLARLAHKPFYIKPVGAGLDLFLDESNSLVRAFLLSVLRSADGILAQTRFLRDSLGRLGCTNAYYLPGCRRALQMKKERSPEQGEFRLIFLAHITREKGPLVLLEALHILAKTSARQVTCDFYGPIHDEIHEEYMEQLASMPNAHYCGVAEAGIGSQLIAGYDALVLPSFFDQEGHPGVLIEAMQVGVPVITTQIRSISDLIEDGENGLLVPMRDSHSLAQAIQRLASSPTLTEKMGQANYRKGYEFRADVVVAQMLKTIFPRLSMEKRSA